VVTLEPLGFTVDMDGTEVGVSTAGGTD
jgi:hypothetical protein